MLEQEIKFELTPAEENEIRPLREDFLLAKENYDKKYALLDNLKGEISKLEQLIIAAESEATASKAEVKNILQNPLSLSVKQIFNLKVKSNNAATLAESYREVKEAMEGGIEQLELDAYGEIIKIAAPRDAYSYRFGSILLNRSKAALYKTPELQWLKMAICLLHAPQSSSMLKEEYDEHIKYKYNKKNIPKECSYSNISNEHIRTLVSKELLSISNEKASNAVYQNKDSLFFNIPINEEKLPTFTPAKIHVLRHKLANKQQGN
jgi:hypothetical protein